MSNDVMNLLGSSEKVLLDHRTRTGTERQDSYGNNLAKANRLKERTLKQKREQTTMDEGGVEAADGTPNATDNIVADKVCTVIEIRSNVVLCSFYYILCRKR
jgi:hypothetical protein